MYATVMIKLWVALGKLHEAQMLELSLENNFGFHLKKVLFFNLYAKTLHIWIN